MPRIEFDGQGTPIPSIALPPFGSDSDLPPTMFTFLENAEFPVEQYRTLGFTHFEAWCVGAAGGRGGDSAVDIPYVGYDEVRRPVPQDMWDLHLSHFDNVTLYSYGTTGGPRGNGLMTQREAQEWQNPTHLMTFYTYKPFLLFPGMMGMGGGGGGGGLHRVSGLLVDLPETALVVVGKAGTDAGYGQVRQLGVWTPTIRDTNIATPSSPEFEYYYSYPLPHPSYPNPQPGIDGGASTFADTVAQASGGKGGGPGMIWDGVAFVRKGNGGDGGRGDRVSAGGGGAGSIVEGVNGTDGVWNPETGIGGGGGGGKGGKESESTGDPRFGTATIVQHLASAGGQGSYSFSDTSVYGQRQFRIGMAAMQAQYVNGEVIFQPVGSAVNLIIPGSGGGARPFPNMKYGGRTTGYSPNGIVVLRLTKITS